jgi:hypothetical protein
MGTAEAVIMLANLTSAAITSLQNAQVISQMVQKAQSENRDTFTPEEWALITGADDGARRALDQAIKQAGG